MLIKPHNTWAYLCSCSSNATMTADTLTSMMFCIYCTASSSVRFNTNLSCTYNNMATTLFRRLFLDLLKSQYFLHQGGLVFKYLWKTAGWYVCSALPKMKLLQSCYTYLYHNSKAHFGCHSEFPMSFYCKDFYKAVGPSSITQIIIIE